MRFLADECCPAAVVEALRHVGHDVTFVLETSPASSDAAIAAEAVQHDRIIVTEDYDFGELAVREGVPLPGLMILAFAGQPAVVRVERTLAAVEAIGDKLRDHITVVGPSWERRRPLRVD